MNVLQYFKPVRHFIFDVDGVLTDGTVLLLEGGLQARQMHVKDGLALQMALRNGYGVTIISGAFSGPVKDRLEYLGMPHILLGIKDKETKLENHLKDLGVDWANTAYMGDDLPDIPVLRRAGLSGCPSDAAEEVKRECHYISPAPGGRGCVRDLIEKVLRLNGHWIWETEVTSR